jgi:hypothetical protein
MGQGRPFKRNEKIDGQGKQVLLIAKMLTLGNNELDRLFHEFCKFEDPTTHTIDIAQIMKFSLIPLNISMSVIFQIFDLSKGGALNFREYLIAMWSFLTTDETAMARLCFSLFDVHRYSLYVCMYICGVWCMAYGVWRMAYGVGIKGC